MCDMINEFKKELKLNKDLDEKFILKALDFAEHAHRDQNRKSGQKYIIHPVAVALNVMSYIKDAPSIVAALLHDVVEDTEVSKETIVKEFGEEVASLVDGVTKLSKIQFRDESHAITENFRKFILSVADDVRILLIKLADRLHNIKTIKFIPNIDKQKKIALETLEIYVPLAERIGLSQIKDELEDLSFEVLNPEIREIIILRLEGYKNAGKIDRSTLENELKSKLDAYGITNYEIQSRIKRPYSIWKKLQKANLDFEDLSDLVAMRVIVDKTQQCYEVLGVIHQNYRLFFSNFRDYISVPKDNGYQSLHTCVILRPGFKVEIQIRTKEMHKIAEKGFAAHWNYKNKAKSSDVKEYLWLKNIVDIINSPLLASEEKYEYSRLEMFDNDVFVFTPKGKLITLPKDSCVLDFAYYIHTDLGNKCTGAKVNDYVVPLYTKLENGNTVNIITSPEQEPDLSWLSFVKTGYARSSIRKYWRNKQNYKIEPLLKNILEYSFSQEELSFSSRTIPKILNIYKMTPLELYESLIKGKILTSDIIKTLYPKYVSKKQDFSTSFNLSNLPNFTKSVKIQIAKCCLPVWGDKIVSFYDPIEGLKVHRENCKALMNDVIFNKSFVKVFIDWNPKNTNTFFSKLTLELLHKPGGVFEVSEVMYKNNINIIELYNDSIKKEDTVVNKLNLGFKIKDLDGLNKLIKELEDKPNVKEVKRYNDII